MDTFSAIISQWPSIRDFGEDLDISENHASVWRYRDSIPADRWADLIDAAQRRGIKLALEDLARIAKAKRNLRKTSNSEHRLTV